MIQPDFTTPSRIFVLSCDCLTLQSCCGCVLAWILTNHRRITRASLQGENSHWITTHQFKPHFPNCLFHFLLPRTHWADGRVFSGCHDYDDEYVILPIRGVLYTHMHTRVRTHTYVYTSSHTHTLQHMYTNYFRASMTAWSCDAESDKFISTSLWCSEREENEKEEKR